MFNCLTFGNKNRWTILFVYLIFILSSIFCFFRNLYHEPLGDDLVYQFVLAEGQTPKIYTDTIPCEDLNTCPHLYHPPHYKRVHTISDAIESQADQWNTHSGRVFVHTITQMFSGSWGRVWFSLFNSVMFFLCLLGIFLYTIRFTRIKSSSTICFIAIAIAVLFYYLYLPGNPGKIDCLIAFSCNYIFPIPLLIIYLTLLRKLLYNETNYTEHKATHICLYIIVALLFGLTQEVFILPMCILTAIIFVKSIFTKTTTLELSSLILPLWIGAASVGLAPGTMNRADGLNETPLLSIIDEGILELLFKTPLFLVGVIICLITFIYRKKIALYTSYKIELALFIIASFIAIFLHASLGSYCGVSIFGMLLLLLFAAPIIQNSQNKVKKALLWCSTGTLLIVFIFHQVSICNHSRSMQRHSFDLIEAYIDSPDGVVIYNDFEVNEYVKPYIYNLYRGISDPFIQHCINIAYSGDTKDISLISPSDTAKLAAPNLAPSPLRGNAGVFPIKINHSLFHLLPQAPKDSILIEYGPMIISGTDLISKRVRLVKAVKRKLKGALAEDQPVSVKMAVSDLDSLVTRWGTFKIVPITENRDIVSVNIAN